MSLDQKMEPGPDQPVLEDFKRLLDGGGSEPEGSQPNEGHDFIKDVQDADLLLPIIFVLLGQMQRRETIHLERYNDADVMNILTLATGCAVQMHAIWEHFLPLDEKKHGKKRSMEEFGFGETLHPPEYISRNLLGAGKARNLLQDRGQAKEDIDKAALGLLKARAKNIGICEQDAEVILNKLTKRLKQYDTAKLPDPSKRKAT